MEDINREVLIEQIDYNIDIEEAVYSIEIAPTSTYEVNLNEQGPQGARGYTGNGISSITKTGTVGLVDTYTILYTNGTSTTFTVTNGRDGTGAVTDVTVNGTSVLDGSVAKVLVPTDNTELTNGAGYITGITSGDVTSALGYTPYSDANPSGYTSNIGTVTSVNGNTPDGTGAITVSIPTVNDATLTINQGGVQKGTFTANASSNVSINLDGNQRNVGEIVTSTVPLTDAGLHLLDGSLLAYGSYQAFIDYIADLYDSGDYPSLFCTEADWQQSNTDYGCCGKYVYDNVNNTVRLPKRTQQHGQLIKSWSSGTSWYRIYEDGWCEQGGITSTIVNSSISINLYKSYNDTNYTVTLGAASAVANGGLIFESVHTKTASSFSVRFFDYENGGRAAYGSWETAGYVSISTLQKEIVYEYIVLATSTKTQIEVDIDQIATDLNGKADVDGTNMVSSVKNFDGKVTNGLSIVMSGVTVNTSPVSIDLSSVLPNDGYDYFTCFKLTGWSTSAEKVLKLVTSTTEATALIVDITRTGNSYAYTSGWLPITSDRKVYCVSENGTFINVEVTVWSYRRMGTNQ